MTQMKKRAVLYARVSSDDRGRDGRNLAGQLEMAREYAQKKGYAIVAELAEDDRGASGASFELPKLGEVLEMAEANDFDVLVPREIDRLSRNLAKQLVVEEELRRKGVEVDYVLGDYPDTPEGRLNKHIRATIAEYEREKIIERMARGRQLKVKAGNVIVHGKPPYGYNAVKVDGKSTLAIHEEEAKVVRLIYHWYTEGDDDGQRMSLAAIARKLTEMGIPTYMNSRDVKLDNNRLRANRWSTATVRNILVSETYNGVWYWGKGIGPSRKPRSAWVPVEVPPIVSSEAWGVARERLAENRRRFRGTLETGEYLVRQRVTCGHCALAMSACTVTNPRGQVHRYYRCPASKERGKYYRECDLPLFHASEVDDAIWQWLKGKLTDPEQLEQGLLEIHQEREELNAPIRNRLIITEEILAKNQAQLERLVDLYVSGEFPREVLAERKARLESLIADLESQKAEFMEHLASQSLSIEEIRTAKELAEQISIRIDAMDADFAPRRQLVEILDLRATLAVENDERVVYVSCHLGDDRVFVYCASEQSPKCGNNNEPLDKQAAVLILAGLLKSQ
jgi:site-specific DNA recombinase